MSNEQLRQALVGAGLTHEQVAHALGVDPKTVQRWVTMGRVPHPRHRRRLVELVDRAETELWSASVSERAELVELFPARAEVPRETWLRLLDAANERFDLLVYAGLFFHEQQPRLLSVLSDKADAGMKFRLMFGDPDAEAIARRGVEEGIGDEAVPVKVRNALTHYRPLAEHPGVDVRLHRTTLYTSIYRFDDEMLVNPHVYGLPAAHAPALLLRRTPTGRLFDTYADCFERVWGTAAPAWPRN